MAGCAYLPLALAAAAALVSASVSGAASADLSPYDGVVMSAVVQADGVSLNVMPRADVEGAPAHLLSADSFAPKEAAWGVFNDSLYLKVGWGKLQIHTNPNLSDTTCATAAGTLEGRLTAKRIYQNAMNSGFGPGLVPAPAYVEFIKLNDQWINTMLQVSKSSTAADISYWHHVDLINTQMKALHQGYTQEVSPPPPPPLLLLSLLFLSRGAYFTSLSPMPKITRRCGNTIVMWLRGVLTWQAKKLGLGSLLFEAILYMNMGDELGDFAGFKPGQGFDRPRPVHHTVYDTVLV